MLRREEEGLAFYGSGGTAFSSILALRVLVTERWRVHFCVGCRGHPHVPGLERYGDWITKERDCELELRKLRARDGVLCSPIIMECRSHVALLLHGAM